MTYDREALKSFAKYIWWKTPDEAVAFPERLVAQVMNIGTDHRRKCGIGNTTTKYLRFSKSKCFRSYSLVAQCGVWHP